MGKRIKNSLVYLALRGLFGLLRLMGWARSLRFGRFLGRVAFRRARIERERTLRHLGWAFEQTPAPEREALAVRVFEHLGQGVAEVVNARKVPGLIDYVQLEPDGRRVLDEVLARGQGVVFVTGHVGNWELMARGLAALGYPINTIGQKSYDPRLTRLLARFRDEGRVHTLWRGEADLVERMVEVLRRGQIMGLLIDQDTDVPGAFVDFFGRPTWTPTAAALLARKTGAPVVMGFNHRRPEGGLQIGIAELAKSALEELPAAVAADTQAMSRAIEAHIRAHPAEWVWMHRRWKTRPPA
jgi:KDO2-lipid IV(A) lauroyltransferase